jgi:hypothetical protein
MDENSREEEITVESRVSGAKSIGAPEHLRGVAKQPSTEGVMVVAGGRGSTEACSKLGDECLCQGAKPWIREAADLPPSQFEIGLGGRLLSLTPLEQFTHLILLEDTKGPPTCIQTECSEGEFPLDADRDSALQFFADWETWGIAPSLEADGVGRIAQPDFPEGFPIACFPARNFLNVCVEARRQGAGARFGADLRDGFSSGVSHALLLSDSRDERRRSRA